MAPKHRFTTAADGTALAYRIAGDEHDGAALVFTNGYATSDFYWKHLARHFQHEARVVTWDLKGHGRSGGARDLEHVSIPWCSDDLFRVMDAAGVERAVLLAFSLGCQVILEAYRQAPERISALIPILGTYGRPFDHLLHPRVGSALYRSFRRLGPRSGALMIGGAYIGMRTPLAHFLNQTFGMIGRNVGRKTMQPFYDHFALIDPKTWVAMGIAAQDHTAEDLLEQIAVPTLVVAGGRDAFTPLRLSIEMRDRIPDCDLVTLPHATHSGLFEYPDEIIDAVDSFLRSRDLIASAGALQAS